VNRLKKKKDVFVQFPYCFNNLAIGSCSVKWVRSSILEEK
jgi:hypothetical protein